jgi:hypothetical protein
MPTTVYTLLCQTDRTGQVLGVFADRAHAAEITRFCAATHAEKLRWQDQQTFKAPVEADIYQVHVEDLDSNVTVSVRHRFLDEPESYRWLVHGFEIVRIRSEEPAQRRVRPSNAATPMTTYAGAGSAPVGRPRRAQ